MNRKNPDIALFSTQESNWCDEEEMLEWIKLVWKPFTTRMNGPTALLLDDYRAHKTKKVSEELSKLGTVLFLMPGGTTSHIQVLDVGVNKPFKTALKNDTTRWMIDNGSQEKRGRDKIADSVIRIWQSESIVSKDSIIATFTKIGYTFH